MKLTITDQLVKELDLLHLNLSHYYLLFLAKENKEILDVSSVHIQTLKRKGYIQEGKLTESGNSLINMLMATLHLNYKPKKTIKQAIVEIKKDALNSFDVWWKTYPAGSTFIDHNGTKWHGGRNLHIKKDECEAKYYEYINSGIKAEDLLKALQYEIEERKTTTLVKGENQFTYMKGTESYLNQKAWMSYLDMIEQEKKQRAKIKISTTIDTQNLF